MKDSAASIVRTYLDAVILSLLEKGDSYGYAVIKEIERVSGGAVSLQEGPLYIEFRRMERDGWIRSYWGDETHGARRRYYAITEEGRAYYQKRQAEWQQTANIMHNLLGSDEGRGVE